VHRDLKPSNLFVQHDGLLKILDFGVARIADSSMTVTGAMLGTPGYMSPEQARGEPVDARSDIFSAGAVFYFMVAGRRPFPGSDLATVLRQLQFEEPAPLGAQVPADLAAIILRTLAKSAADRPARIEELLASLVRFRRQYQADTRKLFVATRAQFDAVDALAKAVTDAGEALGDAPSEPPVAAFRAIQERFPTLFNRQVGIDEVPLERTLVASILRELEAHGVQLAAALETRRSHLAQFAAAERMLAEGDPLGALAGFEALAAMLPTSARCRALVEQCRQLARDKAPLEMRVAELVSDGRDALDRNDWTGAIAHAQQALALAPDDRAAATLAADAEALRDRICGDEIRRARSAFRRGRYDEAVQQLRAVLALAPGVAALEREIDHLDRLREAVTSGAAACRAKVVALLQTAAALVQSGRVDEALPMARDALRLDPTDGPAATLLDRILARQLEDRLALEKARTLAQRTADAAPLLAAARQSLQRGYVAIALRAATAAQRVAPGDADAAALIERARQELADDDRETFELADVPFAPAVAERAADDRVEAAADGAADAAAPLASGIRRNAWT
jgi:tetratricopeptide (TPR) repeat protein